MKKTLIALMASAIAAIAVTAPAQADTKVMSLYRSIPLPDITGGDFDHFAYDLKTNRLYVTAEGHHTVEVFNLRTGEHLASVEGFTTPHSIYLVADRHALFVADGGAASVKVLDTDSLKVATVIPTRPGPDAAFYDDKARLLYVGAGGRVEKTPDSTLTVISVDDRKVVGGVPVDSNNIESMAIDRPTRTLFANLRDKKTVGSIDLDTRHVVKAWDLPGLQLNTPMAYDPATHRLFIVARKPGMIAVMDSQTGEIKSTVPCVDIADDMTFDAKNGRVYVTGAEGLSVFDRTDTDHLTEIQRLDTKGGKTSVYVAPLHQFYVPHTKSDAADAALEIYKVADK